MTCLFMCTIKFPQQDDFHYTDTYTIIQNNRKNEKVYLISCINGFNDAS